MSLVSSKQKFDKNGQEEENNGIAVQEVEEKLTLQTICEDFQQKQQRRLFIAEGTKKACGALHDDVIKCNSRQWIMSEAVIVRGEVTKYLDGYAPEIAKCLRPPTNRTVQRSGERFA